MSTFTFSLKVVNTHMSKCVTVHCLLPPLPPPLRSLNEESRSLTGTKMSVNNINMVFICLTSSSQTMNNSRFSYLNENSSREGTLGSKKSQFLWISQAQLCKDKVVCVQQEKSTEDSKSKEWQVKPRHTYLGSAMPQAVHGHSGTIVCVCHVYDRFADGFDHFLGNT